MFTGSVQGEARQWSVLLAFAAFFICPLLAFLLATTRTNYELATQPLGFGSLAHLVDDWRTITAYGGGLFLLWLRNSILVSLGGTALAVFAGLPAGYALACLRFRLRRPLLLITLVLMVMPNTVLVVPLFLEVNAVHLTDSLLAVLIIFGFYPFGVFLSYIFYTELLPRELLDASRLDGCSEIGVFKRIALPIARPAIALIVFFSMVSHWNNFFLSYVMLSSTEQAHAAGRTGTIDHGKPGVQSGRRGGAQAAALHASACFRRADHDGADADPVCFRAALSDQRRRDGWPDRVSECRARSGLDAPPAVLNCESHDCAAAANPDAVSCSQRIAK